MGCSKGWGTWLIPASCCFRHACTRVAADGLISAADFLPARVWCSHVSRAFRHPTVNFQSFSVTQTNKLFIDKVKNCIFIVINLFIYARLLLWKVQFVGFAHAKPNAKQKFNQREYSPPKSGKHSLILVQKEPLWSHLTAISITKKGRVVLLQHVGIKVELSCGSLRVLFFKNATSGLVKPSLQWMDARCCSWVGKSACLQAFISSQFSTLVSKLLLLEYLVYFRARFLILKCSWSLVRNISDCDSLFQPPLPLGWLSGFINLLPFHWEIMRHSGTAATLILSELPTKNVPLLL